jgi:hypothetical protein
VKIYKLKPSFDPDTGERIDDVAILDEIICDFTGEVINDESPRPPYTIEFKYDHGSEPDWYYDNIEELYDLIIK